jgi:hypothetical protein
MLKADSIGTARAERNFFPFPRPLSSLPLLPDRSPPSPPTAEDQTSKPEYRHLSRYSLIAAPDLPFTGGTSSEPTTGDLYPRLGVPRPWIAAEAAGEKSGSVVRKVGVR